MAEKPSEPVWSIFTNTKEGARLQEYDIFPKLNTPRSGGRADTAIRAPGVKLENLVIDTDTKLPRLERNNGISVSQSARGDPSLVKSKDLTSPRATGRSKVKEENASLGSRENVQQSGSEKVHPTHAPSLPIEFRPSTSTSGVEEPGVAAAMALKYFETKRVESERKSNFPIPVYHMTLKKYYPEFVSNAEHGIVGHVPGVKVGSTLRYRDELRLLGIHREKQKGIDSKDVLCKDGWNHERVALSVVLSGVYEDCEDNGEVLIYVGEGGRDVKTNKQVKDQTKKCLGNQALKNNCHNKIPVRVIRKRMDPSSPSNRLFSYDGLYKVADWEYTTGKAGFNLYRFMLVREPNQTSLVWQKRVPKHFVGRATCQGATVQGDTKRFVGQIGRAARRKATPRRRTKPSVVQAARREATAGGETEPSGSSAAREIVARGKTVRKELATKGKQVSTSIKEDEVNVIDLSDESSVSSDSGESERNSVTEISDDESEEPVSLEESEDISSDGSEQSPGDMQSAESKEKSASILNEEHDFIVRKGEEGGDCLVHEELHQGQKVSPRCVEVGAESGILDGKVPVDTDKVIDTICDEWKDEGVSKLNNSRQDLQDATKTAPWKGQQTENADGNARDHSEEVLQDGFDEMTVQPSRLGKDNGNTNEIDEEDDTNEIDEEYEVEKIVDKRIEKKTKLVKYRVRWLDYAKTHDTWEPVSNLKNCRKLVEEFDASRKKNRVQ